MASGKTPEELKKEGRKLKRRVDKGVKVRGKKVIEKKKSGSNKTKTITLSKPNSPVKTTVKKKTIKKVKATDKQERRGLYIGAAIGSSLGASVGAATGSKNKAKSSAYNKKKDMTTGAAQLGSMGLTAGTLIGNAIGGRTRRKVTRTKTVDGVNKKAAKKVVKSKMKTMRKKRRR